MADARRQGTARDGRDYESLTELVIRLLAEKTETPTVDLRRRARVRGRSTTHEIDVWWEAEYKGTRRQVAFQCKDLARPVDQGEMLKFRAVLDDLDGEVHGVFVARGGYQRGAVMVAAMSNIYRLSIGDRIGDDDELQTEDLQILDAEIKLHRDDQNREAATGEEPRYGDEVIFYDQQGRERGNLLQVGLAMYNRLPPPAEPAKRTRRFREPTFIRDADGGTHRVSSLTLTAKLVYEKPLESMLRELFDDRED
jgi:Restriction endonuclease